MKKKIGSKRALFTVIGAAVVALAAAPAQSVKAASVETLRGNIEKESKNTIMAEYYADYDGDGTEEMFAVVGDDDMGGGMYIWFANDSMTKCVFDDGDSLYFDTQSERVCEVSDTQKLFIMERGGYGSGSNSLCYHLKDGEPVRLNVSEGLTHVFGADFNIYPSAFDNYLDESGMWTGHTWKPYYLRWTGDGFKEYTGKKITLKKFKKFGGAKKYLKKIKKEGYQIDSVIRRSNGVINVNVHSIDSYGGGSFDNVNFRLENGKVTLIKGWNTDATGVVPSSSYGGIYAVSGY